MATVAVLRLVAGLVGRLAGCWMAGLLVSGWLDGWLLLGWLVVGWLVGEAWTWRLTSYIAAWMAGGWMADW